MANKTKHFSFLFVTLILSSQATQELSQITSKPKNLEESVGPGEVVEELTPEVDWYPNGNHNGNGIEGISKESSFTATSPFMLGISSTEYLTLETDFNPDDEGLDEVNRPSAQNLKEQWKLLKAQFQPSRVTDDSHQGKLRRSKNIRFLFRKKISNSNHKWVPLDKSKLRHSAIEAGWHFGSKVKVLLHGFCPETGEVQSPEQKIKASEMFRIGNEYAAKNQSINLIIVDWTDLATYSVLKYYEASDAVPYVADEVTNFLLSLKSLFFIRSWSDVHLIGFSLGAHVAGGVGLRLSNLDRSEKIGRISGIDPAGPLFHNDGQMPPNTVNVLDKEDAQFVDVTHCNMGKRRLATPVQSGHADYYPNGGETQKGCSFFQIACSHGKCPKVFAKSINSRLEACPCSSWRNYLEEECVCDKDTMVPMGDQMPPTARGRYYSKSIDV